MTQSDALLEPLDGYEKLYKDLHLRYTEETFDELAKKGRVDIAANKKTVSEYKAKIAEIEKIGNAISKSKALRTFLIVLSVILGIAGVVMLVASITGSLPLWAGIVAIVVAVALIVLFIVLIVKTINPKIKKNQEIQDVLQGEANKLLNEAWSQMAGLNALYDWDIPQKLVTKTVPVIEMDENLDEKKFTYLREKYGFRKNDDAARSTQFCQSGSILGNPFIIFKDFKQSWKQQAYTGAITIHWTTTTRTKEGTRTVHHSQVLTATVFKPKPVYKTDTYLVYGNEAAPNLSFTRTPSGATEMSEKQRQKLVASTAKKLDKKARKAVSAGESYTRLGNDEFEALFGGTDRDNEVEFRMLFTPLAQKSLLRLIKTPQPYGDDFTIKKSKKLNYLRSKHAQGFDYEVDPVNFINYDFEAARVNFININTTYFKSLYFDLAPLVSIPLYQQHKAREFIYEKAYASNISCYEHESIANSFKKDLLKPAGSATPSILKTELVSKEGEADSVLITAHAFHAERRITYIPRFGGDGRTHLVPVVWIEYLPVERYTPMAVQKKQSSRLDFNLNCAKTEFKDLLKRHSAHNACLYERGVFAMLTGGKLTRDTVNRINEVYGGMTEEDAEIAAAAADIDEEELALLIAEEAAMHDRSNTPEEDADALLKDDSAETKEVEATADEVKPEEEADGTDDIDDTDDDDED